MAFDNLPVYDDQNLKKLISIRIRAAMEEHNLKQKDLQRIMGYNSTGSMSQVLDGSMMPDLKKIKRLSLFLNIPMAFFLSNKDKAHEYSTRSARMAMYLSAINKEGDHGDQEPKHLDTIEMLLQDSYRDIIRNKKSQ